MATPFTVLHKECLHLSARIHLSHNKGLSMIQVLAKVDESQCA